MEKALGKRIFIEKVVTVTEPVAHDVFITATAQIAIQSKTEFFVRYVGDLADTNRIKVGDRVFLGMNTQEPVDIGGEMLMVVKEDDIIAIL